MKTFQNAHDSFCEKPREVRGNRNRGDTGLYFSTLFLDITGIGIRTLVTAGFFILPRKRRQAKGAFNLRIQELIADLKQHIAREFDEYMQAVGTD